MISIICIRGESLFYFLWVVKDYAMK